MPNLKIECAVSEVSLALIKQFGNGEVREEVLRRIVELGLCELMETAARTHRDYTSHFMAGHTKDYKLARQTLFSVDEPQHGAAKRFEPLREVTG